MNILSFSHFKINPDKAKIDTFLNKIRDCKALIINIHDNSGGSEEYWQKNIVERLIRVPLEYTMYPIIKDGAMNREFYPNCFVEGEILRKTRNLQAIPQELLDEKYYVQADKDTLYPNNPVDFEGRIYVLVSGTVFSASENFAQFCKITNWATIAGERTGGDGIGSDPIIVMLPGSGILACYPALIGLNHGGALNFEERTVPNIPINGNNANERLAELIRYIKM
jgi:hypothetical protein